MCDEMSSIFQYRIGAKGIQFQVTIEDKLPQFLLLDETRLRQIMINLLSNAAKFTDKGFVRLALREENVPDTPKSTIDLVIEVTDSGCGITPKDQASIFDAFEQVSSRHASSSEERG